jgi:hypothetical protein
MVSAEVRMYPRSMAARRRSQLHLTLAVGAAVIALGSCLGTIYLASTGRMQCVAPWTNGSYGTQQEARKLAILSLATACPAMILFLAIGAVRLHKRTRIAVTFTEFILACACAWAGFVLTQQVHFCT